MFKSRTDLYSSEILEEIRRHIYFSYGYYIFKNFLSYESARNIAYRWSSGRYNFHFTEYVANSDVQVGTPNYFAQRPTPDDWAFCMHMWNPAIDEELHSAVLEANSIRNLIEGRALHFGTHMYDPLILQYRLARSVSSGFAVKPHADFMEEHRTDPTGPHDFDPRRCQITLFLSDYGMDYKEGGFKLEDNNGRPVLFGRDEAVQSGDLVIWKYSNIHEVSSITPMNDQIGFMRVICPSFAKEQLDATAARLRS